MKKILIMVFVVLMMLCGCTPSQSPGGSGETNVDAKWLIESLNYDKGYYSTADQKTRVFFKERNGDILIRQYNEEDEIEYLINKVTKKDNVYTLTVTGSVSESSKYYVKEFHLDAGGITEGKIKLENLFKNESDRTDVFTFFGYQANEKDLTVISDILMEGSGKWVCAGQFETQYIYMKDGLIYMESTESGSKQYIYKPVTYSVDGTVYAISFDSSDGFILHVDIANMADTRITAENRFRDDIIAEYDLVVDMDESMKPRVYVMVDSELNPEYLPTLTLYADNSFNFKENVYEGMATITGHWVEKDGYIVLYLTDKHELEGYAGYLQQEIGMKIVDGGLKMENDLCYSQNGAFFKKQ